MALYIDKSKARKKAGTDYKIPVRLLRWIERHGYAEALGALAFLTHAAKHAAPVTHPDGNKRYEDLLLTMHGKSIEHLSVFAFDCSTCNDTKVFLAYDPDGTERRWPCPDCAQVDKRRAGHHTAKRI